MAPRFEVPDWIDQRQYQKQAVEAWVSSGGQGILNMATGTGKTITSLLAANRLYELQGSLPMIIAVPYQHLVDQWAEDVEQFGGSPVKAYKSRSKWESKLVTQLTEHNVGSRDVVTVITTHTTFSSDHFQDIISRLDGAETMLIADEVHHLGADYLRTKLPDQIRARLGLSATPSRWYDDKGTESLFQYFGGGVVFEYDLADAIEHGHLSEYYYIPHIVELTEEEAETYTALSKKIGKLASRVSGDIGDADLQSNERLQQLLFKRARLIGSAENKLHVLQNLIEQESEIDHTLVYCGDGKVETDSVSDDVIRQVDAAVKLLGNRLGLYVHRFTAREGQETRQRLLSEFERGSLQALVAIRCLDEGVDVPATKRAYFLASSSNPRQFIQRRGRILRTHPNKKYSVIHDFIVSPPDTVRPDAKEPTQFNLERKLLKKEFQRLTTFAEAARNHPDTAPHHIPTTPGSIQELRESFNLLDQ